MTRQQFAALKPGDRVAWLGVDREDGIVREVERVVVVEWQHSGFVRYSDVDRALFELAPGYFEQVTR